MLEIEYIPLKTPDGHILGHACARGGHVEIRLRAPTRLTALIVTQTGSADAPIGTRVPVSAQVSAIALHENGRLAGCGFSRTSAMTQEDLRRRLHALSPDKAAKIPAASTPREPLKAAEKPERAVRAEKRDAREEKRDARENRGDARVEKHDAREDRGDAREDRGDARVEKHDAREDASGTRADKRNARAVNDGAWADGGDMREAGAALQAKRADAQAAETLAAFVEEIAAGIPDITPAMAGSAKAEPAPREKSPAPREKSPAPREKSPAVQRPDAEARDAMNKRATDVFLHIETPTRAQFEHAQFAEHAPYTEPSAYADNSPSAPFTGADAGFSAHWDAFNADFAPARAAAQWNEDADALLGAMPAPEVSRAPENAASAPVTEPMSPESVPNPFPHIFPDAAFARDENGALAGVWRHGRSRAEISAVPGPYSPQPPDELTGYTRYIRARSGGYWVRVTEE